jgi:hypothetical protein
MNIITYGRNHGGVMGVGHIHVQGIGPVQNLQECPTVHRQDEATEVKHRANCSRLGLRCVMAIGGTGLQRCINA